MRRFSSECKLCWPLCFSVIVKKKVFLVKVFFFPLSGLSAGLNTDMFSPAASVPFTHLQIRHWVYGVISGDLLINQCSLCGSAEPD